MQAAFRNKLHNGYWSLKAPNLFSCHTQTFVIKSHHYFQTPHTDISLATAMPTEHFPGQALPTDSVSLVTALPADGVSLATALPADGVSLAMALPTNSISLATAICPVSISLATALPTDSVSLATAMPSERFPGHCTARWWRFPLP